MAIGKEDTKLNIFLDNEKLDKVEEFTYLGSVFTEDRKCIADTKKRIGKTASVIGRLNKIRRSSDIALTTKMMVYQTLVLPVLLYGLECWVMKKDERKVLDDKMMISSFQ
jgi:hypothetical protein